MKYYWLLFTAIFITAVACTPPPPASLRSDPIVDATSGANPMVHQQGTQIVDPAGNPIQLRGVFLEGWLQWNGTLWGMGLSWLIFTFA